MLPHWLVPPPPVPQDLALLVDQGQEARPIMLCEYAHAMGNRCARVRGVQFAVCSAVQHTDSTGLCSAQWAAVGGSTMCSTMHYYVCSTTAGAV